MKRIKYIIIMLLLSIPSYTYAYSKYIVASGENIGIKIKNKGIIIMGNYDDLNNQMNKGDIIISVEDDDDIDINSFTKIISNHSKDIIKIGYIRDGKYKTTDLNIDNGKTGLYLKDTIAGIGTLTFIDPNTKIFGALGHEIIDSISGTIIDSNGGNIYESKVMDIKRSTSNSPGEKNASIETDSNLGDIDTNTNKGIFGDYESNIDDTNLFEVASYEDVKLGKAYILTELDDNKVDKYEIDIIKINNKNSTKNIVFKVTDKRLLETGIVQGMSGSPIIQDKYIVGAVTHVVVDNPKKGYGILITNMLEEAEKKDE